MQRDVIDHLEDISDYLLCVKQNTERYSIILLLMQKQAEDRYQECVKAQSNARCGRKTEGVYLKSRIDTLQEVMKFYSTCFGINFDSLRAETLDNPEWMRKYQETLAQSEGGNSDETDEHDCTSNL